METEGDMVKEGGVGTHFFDFLESIKLQEGLGLWRLKGCHMKNNQMFANSMLTKFPPPPSLKRTNAHNVNRPEMNTNILPVKSGRFAPDCSPSGTARPIAPRYNDLRNYIGATVTILKI